MAGEGQRPPGACDLWFRVSQPVSGAWNYFLLACGLFPSVFSVPRWATVTVLCKVPKSQPREPGSLACGELLDTGSLEIAG